MLTGDSADELWGNYGSLPAYCIHQLFSNNKIFNAAMGILTKTLPGVKNSAIESLHHLVSPFDIAFVKPFLDFGLFKLNREADWEECCNAYEFLENDRARNINGFLLDELLTHLERFMVRSERVGMAASIEMRLPFLTEEMALFAMNVPFEKKGLIRPSLKRRTMFWDQAPARDLANRLGVR